MTYNPDPLLVTWIRRAAVETGADPNALLATALRESGGKLHGPPGDQGTSFGPFQFHIGGALGTWATGCSGGRSLRGVLDRARNSAPRRARRPGAAAYSDRRPPVYASAPTRCRAVSRSSAAAPRCPPGTPRIPAAPRQEQTPIERIAGNDPFAQIVPEHDP